MNMHSTEGRRRLGLLLSLLGGTSCAIAMALVLLLYGTPYKPLWWLVMAVILIAVTLLARFVARPIEWVIEGYLTDE
jgi:hypothetical protein